MESNAVSTAAAAEKILDQNELTKPPTSTTDVLTDGAVTADEEEKKKKKTETVEDRGERRRKSETPPDDDCCPICFSSFTVPCYGDCGHWYCGSCILQYWNYSSVSRPCKCPMCARRITKLSPEASLQHRQEQEAKEVLAKVHRYNRLFVGGMAGFVQKLQELPFLVKRMVWHVMDTDGNNLYFHEVRIFAIIMSTLYAAADLHFIPAGGFRIMYLFDCAAIAMFLILRLVGMYRRRRLAQRVRLFALAAAEIEQPERDQS